MCTNRALVNSLECYMEELVEDFEYFVKKSLFLISLGVGTVVLILAYMLKVLNERTGSTTIQPLQTDVTDDSRCHAIRHIPSSTSLQGNLPSKSSSKWKKKSDIVLRYREPKLVSSSVNTLPVSAVPSNDERLRSDDKLSNCIKNCDIKKRAFSKYSPTPRISIPSLCTNFSKENLSPSRNCLRMLNRTSCCSMCCKDDKSNIQR